MTEPEKARVTEDLKTVRTLNKLTTAAPSQNVRDLYRAKCWYAPCIIHQLDCLLLEDADARQHYFPSFQQLMEELNEENPPTQTPIAVRNENFALVPGDIVAINPGTENGVT